MEPDPTKQKKNRRWMALGAVTLFGAGLWWLNRKDPPVSSPYPERSQSPPFAQRVSMHGGSEPRGPEPSADAEVQPNKVDTSGIVEGAGAEAGSAILMGLGPMSFGGKIIAFSEALSGFDLGLGESTRLQNISADGAYFPPNYALEGGGTLDLNELGAAASWTPTQRAEVLRQHDEAFAPIYAGAGKTEGWIGLRRARDWLATRKVPLLYQNEPPPRGIGLSETKVMKWNQGHAVRLAPAIITTDPREAKKGGVIWAPPTEWATYGPASFQGATLKLAYTGDAAVWDGEEWITIPWKNWGLQHLVGSGIGARYLGQGSKWDPLRVFTSTPVITNKDWQPQSVMVRRVWDGPNSHTKDAELFIHPADPWNKEQSTEAVALQSILAKTFF